MKKIVRVCLVMAFSISVSACGTKQQILTNGAGTEDDNETKKIEIAASKSDDNIEDTKAAANPHAVLKRMFMFHKKLYVENGETSHALRCGMMDGQITSSVAADQIPTKNFQSNFGEGYGFQYGCRENRLEVCIDGRWRIFAHNENNFDGVSMQVVKNTAASATVEILNTTDLQVMYGEDYTLEVQDKETGDWNCVPYTTECGYNDIAYHAAKDTAVKWEVDWSSCYGKLEPGNYRIVKKLMDFRKSGDYTEYILSAQFTITK